MLVIHILKRLGQEDCLLLVHTARSGLESKQKQLKKKTKFTVISVVVRVTTYFPSLLFV